jgi:hypothetical protein
VLAKRLVGSNDKLLDAVGVGLLWAATGADAGIDRIHGLRPLFDEETARANGIPLVAADRETLSAHVERVGIGAAADALGIHRVTLGSAISGARVKARVRAALTKAAEAMRAATKAA